MSYIRQTSLTAIEPVNVAETKNWLKLPANVTTDDVLIAGLITTAREQAETFTNRCIAQRTFVQSSDSFPWYRGVNNTPNTSGHSIFNYAYFTQSQMIKLYYPPIISVDNIKFIDIDGYPHTLLPNYEEARVYPLYGGFWPSLIIAPNAVLINFTAGYDPDPTKIETVDVTFDGSPPACAEREQQAEFGNATSEYIGRNGQPLFVWNTYTFVSGIPQTLRTAIMMLVGHMYFQREPVVSGSTSTLPMHVESLLWAFRIEDVSDTGQM